MSNTKMRIKKALLSIEKGRPTKVNKDRLLSITSVAEEAGIHRSTIINRHPELAEEIRIKSPFKSKTRTSKDQKILTLSLELKEARKEIKNLEIQLAKAISSQASKLLVNNH